MQICHHRDQMIENLSPKTDFGRFCSFFPVSATCVLPNGSLEGISGHLKRVLLQFLVFFAHFAKSKRGFERALCTL